MSREALRALAAERGWVEFATVDEQSTLLSIMHRCRDRQRAEAVPSAPDMKVALATRIGKIENRFADLREADRAERTLALLRAQPRPFAEEER